MIRRVKIAEFEKGLLLRNGRFVRVLDPGAHWVGGEVVAFDLRRRDTEVDAAPVLTRDTVPVGVHLRVSYRVSDPAAAFLTVYEYRVHLANDAVAAAHRALSKVGVAEVGAEHNRLENEIQDRLALEATGYGLRVEDVALVQVRFPKAVRRKLKRMEVFGKA